MGGGVLWVGVWPKNLKMVNLRVFESLISKHTKKFIQVVL